MGCAATPYHSSMRVARAEFTIEEPWRIPDGCQPEVLRRATDGGEPRLATTIAAYHDGIAVTFLFSGVDDGIIATHLEHDAPLWQEDVVEVFLAPPSSGTRYFEIEVNPLGTTFDAIIDSPDGVRATMRTDLAWMCDGIFAAVRTTPASLDVALRIPFASVGASAGGDWRGNFFRIDRSHEHGDEFTAWHPTMKTPPDFHVPAAFGHLQFD